jgi:DNA damage-binding protein 1
VLTYARSAVLQSHEYGASVLIGDECGRLTAIAWEFDRGQGILETPPGLNGAVRVAKVDMGVVSLASSPAFTWIAPLTPLVISAIVH